MTGLLPRFKLTWDPAYFIKHYGSAECYIVNCQKDEDHISTVAEFFQLFGSRERGDTVWKLKVCSSSYSLRACPH